MRRNEERLVVVDFFATWCGACRGLYPKLCRLARENPDAVFLKVNFEANKKMCKSLGIKKLPFFHFYRGAEGKVDEFTASVKTFHRIRDAMLEHGSDRCSLNASDTVVNDIESLFLGANILAPKLEELGGEEKRDGEEDEDRENDMVAL
mmetsp:Transcript_6013/g.16978  ORF Transcript_6013/g.16978 Transcript_6013/m.16978 type:complete len:149 (+) Transcript_6013:1-447(+)